MDKKIATSPEKKAALEAIREQFKGTDSQTQRTRIMEALQSLGSLSTYEARRYLDIYYPPSRIKELRDEGKRIATHWQYTETESGDVHLIGLYVHQGEVQDEVA